MNKEKPRWKEREGGREGREGGGGVVGWWNLLCSDPRRLSEQKELAIWQHGKQKIRWRNRKKREREDEKDKEEKEEERSSKATTGCNRNDEIAHTETASIKNWLPKLELTSS